MRLVLRFVAKAASIVVLGLGSACSSAEFVGTAPTRGAVNPNSGGSVGSGSGATAGPGVTASGGNTSPSPALGSSGNSTGVPGTSTSPAGGVGSSGASIASANPNYGSTGVLGSSGSGGGSSATGGSGNFTSCSQSYYVPATANPYLAGVPSGTSLTYTLNSGDPKTPTDYAPAEGPVLVTPTNTACIAPGTVLAFSVQGSMTYSAALPPFNADGNTNEIYAHQLGAVLGKGNITAPLDSLIGVFLGSGDPSNNTPPAPLDFSTQAERDYTLLKPQVGQVFFIGTGTTSSGAMRQVVVPQGATSLYFAVMDVYQWNNNLGGLSGGIMAVQ